MKTSALKKILDHPDKDELISKLILGISPKDIHDNLVIRYSNVSEKKFVISEKDLKTFKDTSLDLYKMIQEDVKKTKMVEQNIDGELKLAIQHNSTYRDTIQKLAKDELDLKTMIGEMMISVKMRFDQITDQIQMDPSNVNTRTERLWVEMIDRFDKVFTSYQKYIIQAPDQIIQHNITVQAIDRHMEILRDAVKNVLSRMDIEASLLFMDMLNEEMAKLKPPSEQKIVPAEQRLTEAKIVNEQIIKKLNDTD